jgi:chloride channel protein, CIC family
MGTFYGGIAHVPISSLVMVCELAGSYDLLVPLMLAEGVAFIALRRRTLYEAQVRTRRESPAHRDELVVFALQDLKAGDVALRDRSYVWFQRSTPATEVLRKIADSSWQDMFPVLGDEGRMVGMVNADVVRSLAAERGSELLTLAADLMEPPLSVTASSSLHVAMDLMLRHRLREIPVTTDDGKIVGFLDESDITRAYMRAMAGHQKKDR